MQLDAQSTREPTLPEFIQNDKWKQRSYSKFGLITRDVVVEDGKPTKQWKDSVMDTKFGAITKDATDHYRQ